MKRKPALILALIVTISTLTGCLSDEEDIAAVIDSPETEISSEINSEEDLSEVLPEEDSQAETTEEALSTEVSDEASTEEASEESFILDLAARDLDGNELKLGDCITGNKVTLLNVWGTFCGPCLNEMPYINELYKEYKDQGFGVVGITCDLLDYNDQPILSTITDGKEIISYIGVTYPVIMETTEMKNIFVSSVVPVSYFVDSKGRLIGNIISGARSKDAWEQLINEKLAEVE